MSIQRPHLRLEPHQRLSTVVGAMWALALAGGCGEGLPEEASADQPDTRGAEQSLCTSYSFIRQSGVADNFSTSNGPELPTPSPSLQAWISSFSSAPLQNYDEPTTAINRFFAHTFTNLKPQSGYYLCKATLSGTVNRLGSNDTMALPFSTNNTAPPGYWGAILSSLPASFSLDLAALPSSSGPVNVLPTIQVHTFLDVTRQDDTQVGHLRLTGTYCCLGTPPP